MKKIMIYIMMLFWLTNLYAQEAKLPTVIGPSPEVAQLQRYIAHSIDHSTGAMSLTIPIYEINKGIINLPISIGYQTTGRKVSDETGALGLGWNLNIGGCSLSRTVYGSPDDGLMVDRPYSYYCAEELRVLSKKAYDGVGDIYRNKCEYFDILDSMYPNSRRESINIPDPEYDIFYYSIPGYSGAFTSQGKLNKQPIVITRTTSNNVKYCITIVDDKGITYLFEPGERQEMSVTTSWVIKEISTPDGQKISFEYVYCSKKVHSASQSLEVIDVHANDTHSFGNTSPNNLSYSMGYGSFPRLKKIDFGHGKIEFVTDIYINYENHKQAEGGKILAILIKDQQNNLVKKISCAYSSLDNQVEKLDALVFKDNKDTEIEKYVFKYNPGSNTYSTSKDYWGYKNTNLQRTNLFPSFTVTALGQLGGAIKTSYGDNDCRLSKESFAKEGLLKEIVYPTGAICTFEYELNKSLRYSKLIEGNGLRLARSTLKKDASDTNPTVKDYKYGQISSNGLHTGYGDLKIDPIESVYDGLETFNIMTKKIYPDNGRAATIQEAYRRRIYFSDYSGDMAFFAQMPVFYTYVTEYINGEYRTDYQYEDKYRDFDYSVFGYLPSGILSNEIRTLYQNGLPLSKILSYYFDPIEIDHRFSMTSKKFGRKYSYWQNTNLISKKEFIKIGGVYRPIKITENTFKSTEIESIKVLKINQYIYFDDLKLRKEFLTTTTFPDEAYYSDYYLTIGKDELVKTEETIFDQNQEKTTTKTEYFYNEYSMLQNTKVTNSDGKIHENMVEYVCDVYKASPILNKMWDKNMSAYVTKKTKKVNQSIMDILSVFYLDFGNYQYNPSLIKTQTGAGQEESRIQYHNYDTYGNPLYITKDGANKVVYLWSYLGQYPIAEIKNATYSEVLTALLSVFGTKTTF